MAAEASAEPDPRKPVRDGVSARVYIVNGSRPFSAPIVGCNLAFVLASVAPMHADSGAEFFEKKIRPLLADNCYVCHSSAGNVAMGGLRMDSLAGLLSGGARGPAVVPGSPADSPLIRAVRYDDEKLAMPPTGRLADADVAALERWVALGAPWGAEALPQESAGNAHWSFVVPGAPELPAVRDPDWVRTPIDAFVLARLEAKGLLPAPPAGRRTLVRRAYFDLIGLPPTPEEVGAYLEDEAPGAFSRVVDRLLASPRYGERWGRHWLDVARYSDSNGVDENLVYKNAFRYRDYVIDAFNADKPYDQFVTEQLAGDLLPQSNDLETMYERWTATGFLTLGPKMLAEDDPVKMQMDIVDEQLDTMARAFMGLTVGCARCHDHKFDPIPIADYYAMAGIFKSSKTMENFKVVAQWHEYVLAAKADRDRLDAHRALIESKSGAINAIVKAQNDVLVARGWRKSREYLLAADEVLRAREIEIDPILAAAEALPSGTAAIVREAGEFDRGNVTREIAAGEKNGAKGAKGPYYAEYDITIGRGGDYQLDFLDLESGGGTADLWINGLLMKTGARAVNNRRASPDPGGWAVSGVYPLASGDNTVRLEHASRFPYFKSWLIAPSRLPEGMGPLKTPAMAARENGLDLGFLEQWVDRLQRDRGASASILYAWHAFRVGMSLDGWASPASKAFGPKPYRSRGEIAARYQELFDQALEQWRTLFPEVWINYENERYKNASEEPALPDAGLEAFREFLFEKYGPFRPPRNARKSYPADALQAIKRLERERKALEGSTPEFPRAMGVREGREIGDIPIHIRGSHWTLGESVPRGFLSAILHESEPRIPDEASGRLHLARWLTRPDHPLTARVMVNRLWRWHFGRGIVPTPDNFGRLGQEPTNQPLLDWLALRFVKDDWSMKRMHRLIVLSSTYRMSTAHDARSAEVDPENRLLWRANRRRLEAESMRDAIVALSGHLDFAMGGTILDVNDRQRVASTRARGLIDYDLNRRAVYLPVVRSSLYEVFTAFEFADPSVPNGDRGETVVAPQALFMMNGSIVLRHTRRMADRLLGRDDLDDADRVRDTYQRVLGRPPRPAEVDRALTFVANVQKALGDRAETSEERRARAWQSFCKAIIGSNEFLYLN